MFFGTYTPRLDDKGRLFLPAKFRDRLTEGLVLTKGQDRCIYVWPQASFQEFSDRISKTPFTNKATRDFVRVLFSGASDEVPDKQGRITVPGPLRDYARLDRDCVVVGAMERVEIWDAARWAEYSDEQEESFATLSEEVIEGLL
ncbi:division/cell wall cluster transcriptional repressor MraZ [Mumia sp. zg.B53]|uniref:division/cell wall cluster transcriptional repressor MraZ n=1 Tax=unclassified Mumia TaxID=2621872 RepID=UPI001C6EB2FF|nr:MULTISPECIES: division/cell wall cluster transcriptional repressor MraZ [unclassified Mumia]MBW9206242.1 division/cell wall cluster transcriptional repressor MraZ [Mumia sp. zg.B17]MBW9211464.1 division/cell wall cluster transcriptional repressor MraZ [Mumia sp. zg.B21]MBW9216637.1 division/cell wall cluster transcriptional repressor MraZ [Mumia sp. zg.B53]MDD9349216.1 division/cell wall cluster transcriptional repressor MraZ [Mumia sp.]